MKRVLQIHYHPDQEVGEEDGYLSYCLQCYGKVAQGRKKNNDEEEEEPLSTRIASGQCCCGCGMDAAQSNHYCIYSGKRVMAWCFHESQEVEEGYGSKALCKRCYNSIAPSDGTPNRKAMRANAKEAMVQQGERMRSYAQERAQGAMQTPIEVGTVVRIKVDRVDRGKMDHKSVPGVVCQVTEHNNYRIVCKGGVLKDCLMPTRFRVELIKRAEHYGLEDALQDWERKPKISIREALRAISMLGGQGFFFCSCKGTCDKNSCKCKKNGRQCNSKCHPSNRVCVNQTA